MNLKYYSPPIILIPFSNFIHKVVNRNSKIKKKQMAYKIIQNLIISEKITIIVYLLVVFIWRCNNFAKVVALLATINSTARAEVKTEIRYLHAFPVYIYVSCFLQLWLGLENAYSYRKCNVLWSTLQVPKNRHKSLLQSSGYAYNNSSTLLSLLATQY